MPIPGCFYAAKTAGVQASNVYRFFCHPVRRSRSNRMINAAHGMTNIFPLLTKPLDNQYPKFFAKFPKVNLTPVNTLI